MLKVGKYISYNNLKNEIEFARIEKVDKDNEICYLSNGTEISFAKIGYIFKDDEEYETQKDEFIKYHEESKEFRKLKNSIMETLKKEEKEYRSRKQLEM